MPLLEWRRAMADEDWVDLFASDDAEWARRMEANAIADAEAVK
jgi:hypothetical protein